MSFDRQAARSFFGKASPAGSVSDMNAVNPGIDEHGDLYARLSRAPKRGAASATLAALVGAGVLAGVAVIVFAQGGNRINAEDIAAPSVTPSADAAR